MGRSVSYPASAIVKTYAPTWEQYDIDEDDNEVPSGEYDWEGQVEDLQEYAPTLWPSLSKCDKWIGREDHALLENAHCYIGLSEYCGLTCYWIVPKEDDYEPQRNAIHARWCNQIAIKFVNTFGKYLRVGGFSNGTGLYQKIDKTDESPAPSCDKLGGMFKGQIEV